MTERETQNDADGSEEDRGARQKMGDGIRSGLGALAAFKDALEETIQEARDRGDLSADRAKEIVRDAVSRAQDAAAGARERLDFAHQSELDELERAVEALAARVRALERRGFEADAAAEGGEEEAEGG